jgi:hypothetical protein
MNTRGKGRPKTRHAEIGNERPSAFPAAASVKERAEGFAELAVPIGAQA